MSVFCLFDLQLKHSLAVVPGSNLQLLNPPEQTSYADEEAIVSGFGFENFTVVRDPETKKWLRFGIINGVLRFAVTNVLNNSYCGELLRREVPDTLVCAKIQQRKAGEYDGLCAVNELVDFVICLVRREFLMDKINFDYSGRWWRPFGS